MLAGSLLWAAAVAIQWLSPLIIHPGGRFNIQPAHFAERHGALVIVALGESVAAIGIGAAPAGVTFPSPWPPSWAWPCPPRCGGPTSATATTSGPSRP